MDRSNQLPSARNREIADRTYNRATELYRAGRTDEALGVVSGNLRDQAGHAPSHHLAAVLLFLRDEQTTALQHARKAVELMPASPEYRKTLIQFLSRMNLNQEAEANLDAALAEDPRSVPMLILRAETQLRFGKPRDAIQSLRQATAVEPDNAAAMRHTGEALRVLDLPGQALVAYRRAMLNDPGDPRPHCGAGLVYLGTGEYEQARDCFRKAHDLDPEFVDPLIQLARVERSGPGDEKFAKLETMLRRPGLRAQGRALIGFALGKMYDDCGETDRAFAHFAEANRQRARMDSAPPAVDELAVVVDTLERCCDSRFFEQRTAYGVEDEFPVFIVGMPRSGTTLIETILAAHPQAHGAGELPHVGEISLGLLRNVPAERWDPLLCGLTREAADRAAGAYAVHLRSLAPDARRIIDKMPRNFQHLWLVALLFPRARVIHALRNPIDTCLSCFFTDFARSHNYRNDLSSLGRYYRLYRRLMDHWKRACPLAILEMQYEHLVAEQETASRRAVEFLGLEWHADCLDFQKSKRSVLTASNVQVGRAMYSTSVERWRRYEKHLGPLLEALGDRG